MFISVRMSSREDSSAEYKDFNREDNKVQGTGRGQNDRVNRHNRARQ